MSVTMEDIARMANVSKATVSRVINDKSEGVGEKTRQRIKEIIEETEYNPNLLARGMATSKSKTIGLVIPDITNPFFPELVKAVESCASRGGYTVFLCNTDDSVEKEETTIENFITKRVDGIILTSACKFATKIHHRLRKYNMPCVLLDRTLEDFAYTAAVYIDNEYAVYTATEYLIHQGHREIACIAGPSTISTSQERLSGYRSALLQHGIPYKEELVLFGKYSMESGYELTGQLLEQGHFFTGVLLGNDIMAIGAIKALRERRLRVPRDVSVIGFDNIQICTAFEPRLTTIQQPTYELGEKATHILIELLAGKVLEQNIFRLQPKLLLRDSVAKREEGLHGRTNFGGWELQHGSGAGGKKAAL